MKKLTIDGRMINSSGIGTVIQNVAKRLVIMHPDWLFSIIGSMKDLEGYEFVHQSNVEIIPAEIPIYSIQEQIKFPHLIPKDSDLLWVPHYNIPVFYQGPLIATVHDVFHLAMPQFVGGPHKRLYAKLMFHEVAKQTKHIICVSKFTKNELIKYTGISEGKISVVYNGVDEFWSSPLEKKDRNYPRPYILFVGNVKPHKNLRRLVKAFQSISSKIPQDLIIVGKKEGFITGDTEVAKMAETMGNRIHFTGFVSNEELKNYYHYADLFAFPSLYEGFGLPPLEAISAGCRNVAVSDIPVLHEIYGDAVSYFEPENVFSIASQIIHSLGNGTVSRRMCQKIFNWDSCAASYAHIMEDYLS